MTDRCLKFDDIKRLCDFFTTADLLTSARKPPQLFAGKVLPTISFLGWGTPFLENESRSQKIQDSPGKLERTRSSIPRSI